MLSPADIKAQALRKYPTVLRAIANDETVFPMDVRFGRPATTADWATLQSEISALAQGKLGCEIEWEEINTRRWGRQRLPSRVRFADETNYLRLLGKTEEVQALRANLALTHDQCPALAGWLAPHVMRVVEHARVWTDVLKVCCYFLAHPRPGRYARELPIHVGTKFIEDHRPLFRSLFDYVLPTGAVDFTSEHFETRYGLRFDEPLIRFRVLDSTLLDQFALCGTDISLTASQFAALGWRGLSVVVVENKMTFLTVPPLAGTIAIWGGGNAAAVLSAASWLEGCRLFYWGDLDVHGMHILATLRQTFPSLQNVMMDEETLERYATYQVKASVAGYEKIEHLTPHERQLYTRLKSDGVLLEQEKIPHVYVEEKLRAALLADTTAMRVPRSEPDSIPARRE